MMVRRSTRRDVRKRKKETKNRKTELTLYEPEGRSSESGNQGWEFSLQSRFHHIHAVPSATGDFFNISNGLIRQLGWKRCPDIKRADNLSESPLRSWADNFWLPIQLTFGYSLNTLGWNQRIGGSNNANHCDMMPAETHPLLRLEASCRRSNFTQHEPGGRVALKSEATRNIYKVDRWSRISCFDLRSDLCPCALSKLLRGVEMRCALWLSIIPLKKTSGGGGHLTCTPKWVQFPRLSIHSLPDIWPSAKMSRSRSSHKWRRSCESF